jgi:hypothetical protein
MTTAPLRGWQERGQVHFPPSDRARAEPTVGAAAGGLMAFDFYRARNGLRARALLAGQ